MDQFEEDVFPREPEDTEQPAQTVADEPAAEEAAAEETLEEAASAEETVAEGPEPQPPYHCPPPPPPPPHRRSPYENAPYMMPHRPPHQGIPPVPPPPPPRPTPEQAEEPKKKRKGHPVRKTLLIVVVLLGSMFATAALTANYCQNYNNQMVGILQRQINELQEQLDARENVSSGESISGTPNTTVDGGLTPAQVYVQNEQSVVLIQTDVATGSGFILRSDGYVVTNYHVVEDAAKISVVLYDNTDCDAELVGYDDGNDLAVLKMEGVDFRPVTLGSSDDLIVGDQVVAIGNPLGELTSTLTVGYVSAKERDVYTDSSTINMIQTDCAINSGNSGGPLFNMNGEVVGITTAKYSGMSSSGASIEGIGFAIPIDDVAGLIEDLVDYGYVKGAYLGVSVYSVDAATAKMYNIPLGCLVDDVTKGSCADAAGIKDADVIIGLGGYEVDSYTDLVRALRKFEPGDTTTITVYRSGQELTFSITLDEKPHEEAAAESQSNMPESGSYEEWYNYFFGE